MYCTKQNILPLEPTLEQAIEFLVHLFHNEGLTYNQICSARSALSSILFLNGDKRFGEYPLVKRVLKGMFQIKPVFPKYNIIWNVKSVFDYLRYLPHQDDLPLNVLSKKLVLLMSLLAGGQRMQTIHLINLSDIKVFPNKIIVPILEKIKQTRPGKHMKPLEFHQYPLEPKLCVPSNLKSYLEKTIELRSNYSLFISYIKPHKSVSKDTISRWCKDILKLSGIDVNKYSSHSCRSAVSSYLKDRVKISNLLDAAGWSNEQTFARFYRKEIEQYVDLTLVNSS